MNIFWIQNRISSKVWYHMYDYTVVQFLFNEKINKSNESNQMIVPYRTYVREYEGNVMHFDQYQWKDPLKKDKRIHSRTYVNTYVLFSSQQNHIYVRYGTYVLLIYFRISNLLSYTAHVVHIRTHARIYIDMKQNSTGTIP